MEHQYSGTIKTVGVFCGSSIGLGEEYREEAVRMGHLLVREGISMVYGGGNIGLMGVIADAMLEKGGSVTGVIPEQLMGRELAHQGVTDMRVVDGMSARKELIWQLSDAFIAMPGGYGTMDELFEMLTQYQLGISDKPCGLLNVQGFYDPLVQLLDHFVTELFLSKMHRAKLLVAGTSEALWEKILMASVEEPENDQWIEALKKTNRY